MVLERWSEKLRPKANVAKRTVIEVELTKPIDSTEVRVTQSSLFKLGELRHSKNS